MEQNTVQKPDCAAITAQARQAVEELLSEVWRKIDGRKI